MQSLQGVLVVIIATAWPLRRTPSREAGTSSMAEEELEAR